MLLGACRSGDGSDPMSGTTASTGTTTPTTGTGTTTTGTGTTGTTSTAPASNGLVAGDTDILNFALNLEYLEAEFYQRAVNGMALPDSMTGGTSNSNGTTSSTATSSSSTTTANAGTVTGGRQVSFATPVIRQLAKEIAHNETLHVGLVRGALGSQVIARPALDIQDSFTALFRTAGIIGADEFYDPYANEVNFLLAASVFEDVGVSAYKGSAALISSTTVLTTAAGILAAEAYHASILRTLLYNLGVDMPTLNTRTNFDKLSNARDMVDGDTDRDQGISPGQGFNASVNTNADTSNIAPSDINAIAFGRSANQVLNVAYQTSGMSWAGGFFPMGVNGTIRNSNTITANNNTADNSGD